MRCSDLDDGSAFLTLTIRYCIVVRQLCIPIYA